MFSLQESCFCDQKVSGFQKSYIAKSSACVKSSFFSGITSALNNKIDVFFTLGKSGFFGISGWQVSCYHKYLVLNCLWFFEEKRSLSLYKIKPGLVNMLPLCCSCLFQDPGQTANWSGWVYGSPYTHPDWLAISVGYASVISQPNTSVPERHQGTSCLHQLWVKSCFASPPGGAKKTDGYMVNHYSEYHKAQLCGLRSGPYLGLDSASCTSGSKQTKRSKNPSN